MNPSERTARVTANMGKEANQGFTRDDSSTGTRLLDKNWSPLIVRKYMKEGWPFYIGVICDANLNDLDQVVNRLTGEAKSFLNGGIQDIRNYCGYVSDKLVDHYNSIKEGCVEGIAVLWYVDKMFCSSLYGDFMTHGSCKQELFAIINTLPHV